MATIFYSYHNFTDGLGNNVSPANQAKNYPELFGQVAASGVCITEGVIPVEQYRDGSRVGYLHIPDEIMSATGFTIEYIEQILLRLGGVFSLYIVNDIHLWLSEYTNLSEDEVSTYINNSPS